MQNEKPMNKIIPIIFCFIALSAMGQMRTATEIAADINSGWNLGNSLEAYSDNCEDAETSWGNPRVNFNVLDSVAKAGFNAIRIPVRWYPNFKDDGRTITIDQDWINRVKEIVNHCIYNNNMYVVLNTHHEHWLENHPFYNDSTEVYAKERRLWKAIAAEFADYDDRLLFAGTNEVHVTDDWNEPKQENADVQNGFNRVFVETVRNSGGNNKERVLIMQTYGTNSYYGPKYLIVPKDFVKDRLMVEVHFYDPYQYCASGEDRYFGEPFKNYGISSRLQENYIDYIFSSLKTLYAEKGLPIIMGEYGAQRYFDTGKESPMLESRKYYYDYLIRTAKKSGAVPFVWDNGYGGTGADQFGLFDRNTGTQVDRPTITTIISASKEPLFHVSLGK